MGKKSSSTKIPASVGEAMKQQAAVAQQQQDWMENEMFPWLQEQANISNENAEKDREFNQANAEWWQNYAQENADKLNEKADWYFDRFQNTYAPIEDSLIKDMERYNDGVEAERQAGYAIGDIASSFATQRRSNAMRAQAYGINPTSGAYQAQQRAMDLQQASLSAAAANQARNAAQQLGWQKKLQVAGLGDKYIGAVTTDFAVMYLPSESVYAEVVRDTNLMDRLRRDCSVVPCGPSTMAALLNSLKMGFTTMKLQKSSKEIAQAFGDFKKQFEKFTGLVETARKQNQTVGGTLEQIADRTGKVMKKINKIANENPEVGEEEGGTALPGGDAE